jgi:hypothetical protein
MSHFTNQEDHRSSYTCAYGNACEYLKETPLSNGTVPYYREGVGWVRPSYTTTPANHQVVTETIRDPHYQIIPLNGSNTHYTSSPSIHQQFSSTPPNTNSSLNSTQQPPIAPHTCSILPMTHTNWSSLSCDLKVGTVQKKCICTEVNCRTPSQFSKGGIRNRCIRHGGKPKCTEQGCNFAAVAKDKCRRHGSRPEVWVPGLSMIDIDPLTQDEIVHPLPLSRLTLNYLLQLIWIW